MIKQTHSSSNPVIQMLITFCLHFQDISGFLSIFFSSISYGLMLLLCKITDLKDISLFVALFCDQLLAIKL